MSVRINGATSGYVELDAPAVADNQRYQVPSDLGIPAGAVMQFAGNVAPAGWLKANGGAINRTAYPKLWAWAQGSGNIAASEGAKQAGQFGPGDGTTTFSIPDLRGEFIRGWDDGRGVDSGRGIGGFQDGTWTRQMINDYSDNDLAGSSGFSAGQAYANPDATTTNPSSLDPRNANGSSHIGVHNDNGTQTGHNSNWGFSSNWIRYRPRNVALLFCIKY